MHLALVELESGLALAAVYSLIAVSLTFTYRVTGVVQLAQGDIMMCGAFAGYFVGTAVHSLPLAILASVTTAAILGFLAYEGAFRWLLAAGHLPPLVVGLALATALEEALRILFFSGQPVPFPSLSWTKALGVTGTNFLVIGIALSIGVAFEVVLQVSRVGRDLRAVADNPEMARALGIPAERMRMLAFVAGAAIAGVAGVLVAVIYGSIAYNGGQTLEFVAIASILLGGLGSVSGAVVGAVVIGLGQAFVGTYISSSYDNAFTFGIVLIIIMARPTGILGADDGVRA